MTTREETTAEAAGRPFSLPPSVRGVRAAFLFFTTLPVGGFPYRNEDHSWALAHAPLVGAVVGAASGLACFGLRPLGSFAAAVGSVSVVVWLTGALHEDGLADTADALGGGRSHERILEILKDSRIGAFGATTLFLSLASRVALVQRLGAHSLWALPLVECLARVGPVWLVRALPYVTPAETSKSGDLVRADNARVIAATAWGAGTVVLAVQLGYVSLLRALCLVAVLLAGWLLLARWFRRRLGGITGDFLGAAEQVGLILALAVLAWEA